MTGIAIVGRGAMAQAHARAWSELGLGDNIDYVNTLTAGPPLTFAPLARFEPDLGVVLRDPEVQIVSVCTPTPSHASIAIDALRAGKSVLLEKPIALTIADAVAIRDEAARSQGVLMVAHVVRFFAGYRVIRETFEAGTLGTALAVSAGRFSPAPRPSTWWHDESKSGGIVVDFSIHDFDQLNLFLGRPLSVSARRARPDGPVEATVDYAGGGVGRATGFMGMPTGFSFASSLDVVGSAGLADHRFSGVLHPVASDASAPDAVQDSVRVQTAAGTSERAIPSHNPYRSQAEYFLECVRTGAAPDFCPVDDAILALAVALAAKRSLGSGAPVGVETA
ncbi:Gfo/Idh/MocA family protein [Lacisediminihabitans profunda]|uniref:Gfo/Idh/MocA family oxidoreductase n=1 Tax=Lacisediminihabitans profunda TaxID=2594790 RepID=A0A5C8UP14_9MICO|nr:Gfo/Idh/MocA family oxidoreductase [Lacisediminihabitans profunda]TXN29226.1 Gfo/Idh/MocA family oxidoreductase [Lacisediminihabitans profunda]